MWLVQGPVLRWVILRTLPRVAAAAGYEMQIGQARAGLFAPVVLNEVTLRDADGTEAHVAEVEIVPAGITNLWSAPRRWVRRISLRGVEGQIAVRRPVPPGGQAPAAASPDLGLPAAWLPRIIALEAPELKVTGAHGSLTVRGLDLLLNEEQTGWLRVGEASAEVADWRKDFAGLQGVTAWRNGVAYLSDFALAENLAIANLSWAFSGPVAVTAEVRGFGGYAYGEWGPTGDRGEKLALNAFGMSLEDASQFCGWNRLLAGRIDTAKLTFNGSLNDPLAGQMSLRLEATALEWGKRKVDEVRLGASISGREIKVNEFHLVQPSNRIDLHGSVLLPADSAAWREAPVEAGIAADVRDLRAIAAFFREPWNSLSGAMRLDGSMSGRAGDGTGWLSLRGWDIEARGVPVDSIQADATMQGREISLANLEAWSGRNFLRAVGGVSLGETLEYRGRLESRVGELARYLEPLGRFAPDWAREGGVLLFWDGDGTAGAHSGVVSLELVNFTGDLNPVPVNAKFAATYSPGNAYISRFLLHRGESSLSALVHLSPDGISAQDIQLFDANKRLLRGELFLPVSYPRVAEGLRWSQALVPGAGIYASVRSDNLDLESLARLFGQKIPLRGRVDWRLDADGPWENPRGESRFVVEGLEADFPSWKLPSSRLEVATNLGEKRVRKDAKLSIGGSEPVRLQTVIPVMGKTAEGYWTLVDTQSPWEAQLEIPRTAVAPLGLRPAGLEIAGGKIAGSLKASNTLAEPRFEGSFSWSDGRVVFPSGWQPLEQAELLVDIAGTSAKVAKFSASMGGGALEGGATVDLSDIRHPQFDLGLRGSALLMYSDNVLQLRGSPALAAEGSGASGSVTGTCDVAGSRILRHLFVTPRLAAGAPPAGAAAPAPPASNDGPFSGWSLDLHITSSEPVPIGERGHGGSVQPDFYLAGTLGHPFPAGTLSVTNLTVNFPKAVIRVPRGAVHFGGAEPWVPSLELAGSSAIGAFEVRAGVFGSLPASELLLSSDPALSAEQIVILLKTGVSPAPSAVPAAKVMPPGEKMAAEPSWLDMDRLLGLFGWNTSSGTPAGAPPAEWSLTGEPAGYDWEWR